MNARFQADATPVTNTGELLATAGGTLVLNAETIANTGGTVQVDASSPLDLENAAISGGNVNVGAGGTLDATGSSFITGVAFKCRAAG